MLQTTCLVIKRTPYLPLSIDKVIGFLLSLCQLFTLPVASSHLFWFSEETISAIIPWLCTCISLSFRVAFNPLRQLMVFKWLIAWKWKAGWRRIRIRRTLLMLALDWVYTSDALENLRKREPLQTWQLCLCLKRTKTSTLTSRSARTGFHKLPWSLMALHYYFSPPICLMLKSHFSMHYR